ncbi:MAG: DUF922 domain-containing protein [Chitinophagaceae bacterium]|nr:DUF922 domain-containing protein [Chitinophagaceae bacterium]
MKKIRRYFLTALILTSLSFSQSDKEELIDWKAGQKLSWSDYKGNPDPDSDAAALTATYLGIEYDISEKGLSWKIQCRFSKTRSWGRSRTDHILQHEQGHFDIAEIFARKLNKKMSEYKFDKNSYQKDLRKIYESITTEKEKFQDQYDKESDHSRNKEKQAEWTKKIAEMLSELKDLSQYQ